MTMEGTEETLCYYVSDVGGVGVHTCRHACETASHRSEASEATIWLDATMVPSHHHDTFHTLPWLHRTNINHGRLQGFDICIWPFCIQKKGAS